MPGSEEFDQCPFCNAFWGECMHVKLLAQWEADALEREAQEEAGRDAMPDKELQTGIVGPAEDDLSSGSSRGPA